MSNIKLCLGVSGQFGFSTAEQIRIFSEIGFDAFFTGWDPDDKIAEWNRLAAEHGMIYQSIHAPFTNAAKMWKGSPEEAKAAVDELCRCLEACARGSVPIMVAHTFIGFKDHEPNAFGIENYGIVARRAAELGVKLALENTEGEEYLAALMDAFRSESSVGFCFDSGHELCYNRGKDMLALYGDRLLCTHLNDNLGISDPENITWLDDLHLLPYDGVADWKGIAERLTGCGYIERCGMLTFELCRQSKPNRHENDRYTELSDLDYLREVFDRASRFADSIAAGA